MLYQKEIPNKEQYDVIVAGGGVSGFAAAVGAARSGMRTALIERQGALGGVAVNAGVCHLLGIQVYDGQTGSYIRNVAGICKEVTDGAIRDGEAIDPSFINRERNPHGIFSGLAEGFPFDPEPMKVRMERIAVQAGVHLYYLTEIVDADIKDGCVKALILHNKDGLFALSAGMFVDATGDADIAYMCGCPTMLGRDGDNLMAPASLEFHLENVDREAYLDYAIGENEPRCRRLITVLREQGIWTFPYDIMIAVQLNAPDIFMINTPRLVGVNGVDGKSLTCGLINGRDEIFRLYSVLKNHFPGFSKSRIRFIAPMIGIRETRRIDGEYCLSVRDLVDGVVFKDSVAVSSYGWDLPDPHKPSFQPMVEVKRRSVYTHIPYRALVPKLTDNLIVAGRNISCERDAMGPVRVMGPCFAMGEAAGIAAAMALKENASISGVDVTELQNELTRRGAIVNMC